MALINNNSPWFGAVGKIGGLTLQGSSSGTVIKCSKTKLKRNRYSEASQLNYFIAYQQAWKSLSLIEKTAWYSYANTNNFILPNNTTKLIQAVNWFNIIGQLYGGGSFSILPTPYAPILGTQFTSLNATNASNLLKINFTLFNPPSQTITKIYTSPPIPKGSKFPWAKCRLLTIINLGGVNNWDITTTWEQKFNLNFIQDVVNGGNSVAIGLMNYQGNSLYPRGWQTIFSSN